MVGWMTRHVYNEGRISDSRDQKPAFPEADGAHLSFMWPFPKPETVIREVKLQRCCCFAPISQNPPGECQKL